MGLKDNTHELLAQIKALQDNSQERGWRTDVRYAHELHVIQYLDPAGGNQLYAIREV
jgi:hypothetical protein